MYTMRLSDVIEARGGSTEVVEGVLVLDKPEILHLDSYPLHNEAHRVELNGLILDTYWNHQIAHETVDIFKQRLRVKLRTVMPMYNQLYKSAELEFDPLITTDMLNTITSNAVNTSSREGTIGRDTTTSATSQNTSSRESTADSVSTQLGKTRSVASDTPETQLSDSGLYATNGVDGKNESNTDSSATDTASASENVTNAGDESTTGTDTENATENATNDGESRTVGYNGSPAALIQAYRETILNIDQMIIDELDPLFFILWGSTHNWTTNRYEWTY